MKIIWAPTFNVKKMLLFRIGVDVVEETWIEPKCTKHWEMDPVPQR